MEERVFFYFSLFIYLLRFLREVATKGNGTSPYIVVPRQNLARPVIVSPLLRFFFSSFFVSMARSFVEKYSSMVDTNAMACVYSIIFSQLGDASMRGDALFARH